MVHHKAIVKQDKKRSCEFVSNSLNILERRIKPPYSKGSGLPCGVIYLLFPGNSVKLQLFSSLLIWEKYHHLRVCPLDLLQIERNSQCCSMQTKACQGNFQTGKYVFLTLFLTLSLSPTPKAVFLSSF